MRRSTAIPAALLLAAGASAVGPAEAGHESPFYPSYYPHEIRIAAAEPSSAAAQLRNGHMHAYVGGDPFAGGAAPDDVRYVESFGSYLVITFNPAAPAWSSRVARCVAAGRIVKALTAPDRAYRFHPYPVTPYHADYLGHADLAEAAKARVRDRSGPESVGIPLKLAAKGPLAERVVPARWRAGTGDWDAAVEEVDLGALVSPHRIGLNGWLGPPWLKDGWFHAYLLFAGAIADRRAREAAEAAYRRLVTREDGGGLERLDLERKLVSLLTGGCERVVAGYTVRREAFSTEYAEGIENVAHDSHTGLDSALFVRTAKLKDFPWNGWLRLGVGTRPAAAWNPVGGFTDPAGQLIWAAVGEPALFPEPYGAGWVSNRVTATVVTAETVATAGAGAGGIPIPRDALLPDPGTGALEPVGAGKTAKAKVRYRVLASLFHDGTRMTMADVLYPFVFAYREHDPLVEASTAVPREWLAGLTPVGVEQETRDLGDLTLTYEVPVVEAYLRHPATDPQQAVAVAPPWSSVPWHLLVLMEEAVKRGAAAFSAEEARRRGVAWLDLARDQRVKGELASLVDGFARQGYVPASLARWVTAGEARERWAALGRFFQQHGHFLVTNGPYRLDTWSADSAVLQVFRDLTYPLGVGTFDRFALPRRAFITKADLRGDRLEISAEVERVRRFQRSYELVRELFGRQRADDAARDSLVCRYVVVGPDGAVLKAGTAPEPDGARFTIDLGGAPGSDLRTIMVALYLNGNAVEPDVRVIPYRRDGRS